MMEWKNLVTTSPEALVFCTRLFCKLAEMFIGLKVGYSLAVLNLLSDGLVIALLSLLVRLSVCLFVQHGEAGTVAVQPQQHSFLGNDKNQVPQGVALKGTWATTGRIFKDSTERNEHKHPVNGSVQALELETRMDKKIFLEFCAPSLSTVHLDFASY